MGLGGIPGRRLGGWGLGLGGKNPKVQGRGLGWGGILRRDFRVIGIGVWGGWLVVGRDGFLGRDGGARACGARARVGGRVPHLAGMGGPAKCIHFGNMHIHGMSMYMHIFDFHSYSGVGSAGPVGGRGVVVDERCEHVGKVPSDMPGCGWGSCWDGHFWALWGHPWGKRTWWHFPCVVRVACMQHSK